MRLLFDSPGILKNYIGSTLAGHIRQQVIDWFVPSMNEGIQMVFRRDADTCAISSFACAIQHLSTIASPKKYRSVLKLMASRLNSLVVRVGGGSFDFVNEIILLFEEFHNLWLYRKQHKSFCILESKLFESPVVGNHLYSCCL